MFLFLLRLGDIYWAKAHHQWANAQAKSFIYVVDVVEDALIMCAKNAVLLVATEKLLRLENMHGKRKRFKSKE